MVLHRALGPLFGGVALASLFAAGCAEARLSDEPTETSEAAIRYTRFRFQCDVRATEQDIDRPERSLPDVLQFGYTYRTSDELPEGYPTTITAGSFRLSGFPLFDVRWYGWHGLVDLVRAKDTVAAAALAPVPAEVGVRMFYYDTGRNCMSGLSPCMGPVATLLLDQNVVPIRPPHGVNAPGVEFFAAVGKEKDLSDGSDGAPSLGIDIDRTTTLAMLAEMGGTRPTSPNLPAYGRVGVRVRPDTALVGDGDDQCETKQLHLSPFEDNGLSFHVTFCCSLGL
jgi:hypothetical protein